VTIQADQQMTPTPAPRQRVIGMLGGMSWESTAEYYRLTNEGVRDRLGGLHSARVVLTSLDFAEIEALQVVGEWDRAGEILAAEAARLEAVGAELLLLCTNTMHKVADQVQAAVSIPLLHLADTTGAAVHAAGLNAVGLLATGFTMEQDFYRDRLASHGLRVFVPDADDRAEVHRIIYDELCRGVIREESRQLYRRVIDRLVVAGAQGVILGCTEIELLIGPADSPVPVFPTTRLHVEAALDASLAGPPTGAALPAYAPPETGQPASTRASASGAVLRADG
jgi:aspartate racemase